MPILKHEIAADPSQPLDQQTQKPQLLDKDRESLEEKVERLEERIESLQKVLSRNLELKLHNKANEIQDEICQRRYELLVAQIHLSAVRAQLQLFEFNFRPNAALANLAASLGLGGATHNQAALASGSGLSGTSGSGPTTTTGSGSLGGQSMMMSPMAASDASGGDLQQNNGLANLGMASLAAVGGAQSEACGAQNHAQQAAGDGTQLTQMPIGYKNKWIKAFKSLRDTSTPSASSPSGSSAQTTGLVALLFHFGLFIYDTYVWLPSFADSILPF